MITDELIQQFMDGADLYIPVADVDTVPLDFVVEDDQYVYFLPANWWTNPQQSRFPIIIKRGELVQRENNWQLDSDEDVLVTIPSDEVSAEILRKARERVDLNRSAYLQALELLVAAVAPADLSVWIDAINDRPLLSAVEELQKRSARIRKISRVFLQDADNNNIDVLVTDEDGEAATARGNEWLEAFADGWGNAQPTTLLEDFMGWVASQRPYGPFSLAELQTTEESGDLEDIAEAFMSV